tara:strand:+ start:3435 stop:4844 length:1410 start_codon:yes stop_codon:yes gene_type:complete
LIRQRPEAEETDGAEGATSLTQFKYCREKEVAMKEVKCPKCDSVFEIDASGYADIVKQIRSKEFEHELNNRLADMESNHKMKIELAEQSIATEKDKQIMILQNQISNHAQEIDIAKNDALTEIRKELHAKEKQVERLQNERKAAETTTELLVTKATSELEKEILGLKNKLDMAETEKDLEIKQLEQTNLIEMKAKEDLIRFKEEEITRVKDMKLKMSVKDIGEKLEQWCENQFNLVRATAFPYAYFEKDNESVKDEEDGKGTKGDYIFRDSDPNGLEYISIMFEMKDKMEGTKGQTNESHLAKLDKDRNKKKCEYAVLVSMLEPENELFNSGPVDMSHKYEKMYVVRPHEFMLILSLIRNEARKSLEMRNELAIIRSQNIDYETFEDKLIDFQDAFGKNVATARDYYEKAITDIDATIKKLEKIKASLTTSGRQLRLANDKTQDLSIKKLTRGNPTMKAKFDQLKSNRD